MSAAAPFSRLERMIAWRYLRARRSEGGVGAMTWISLIGVALAVFALIATLAVRSGFRAEFVDTILGANPHVTLYPRARFGPLGDGSNGPVAGFADYGALAEAIGQIEGVIRAAPVIEGQVMASGPSGAAGAEVFGLSLPDLARIPLIGQGGEARGDLARFERGIAIGSVLARDLGVDVGSRVRLLSPDGVKTAFGTSARVKSYEIVYIFTAGRYDIDQTRIYMPFTEAQSFFNREGLADVIEVAVNRPEEIADFADVIDQAAGEGQLLQWTWQDRSGAFLRALKMEDNIMFIILSILVLIAVMNITSGLIMLVKNKGHDIGVLRTIGLDEGAILRVFFLCGALIGIIGTFAGVILGCLFALYVDPIVTFVNSLAGGDVWDPSIRGIYNLPAKLRWEDVALAVGLSLGLSFVVTIFPARRAARMNPVEALRYE